TSLYSWVYGGFEAPSVFRTVAVVVIFVFGYLLLFGSFYIYPMMVSFDLTVKQLIRNSVILALTQFWRNIVMLLVMIALLILTYLFWPLTLPVPLFLGFTLMAYVSNALIFPVLERYVATPVEEKTAESSENTEEDAAE
ncbi:MAG: hypothetical protein IIV79_01665, partial [Clostridia bacterium]|nr:hypothetical protein [Clostridia bacterium]